MNADVRCVLLRSLQQELDGPRLPEIEARYLGSYFDCLRRIGATIREDMLNSRDISEWSIRHALKDFDEMWRKAEEEEEEERQRSESDANE